MVQFKSYEDALEYCRERDAFDETTSVYPQIIVEYQRASIRKLFTTICVNKEGDRSQNCNLDVPKAAVIERIEKVEGCLYSHQNVSHSHVHCLITDKSLM